MYAADAACSPFTKSASLVSSPQRHDDDDRNNKSHTRNATICCSDMHNYNLLLNIFLILYYIFQCVESFFTYPCLNKLVLTFLSEYSVK